MSRVQPAAVYDVAAVASDVVQRLSAAGLRATADVRDLNPPAVYVGSPSAAYGRLATWTSELDLYVVVPNAGRLEALAALGPMLEQVFDVMGGGTAFPFDLVVAGTPDPLPGYRIHYALKITPEGT